MSTTGIHAGAESDGATTSTGSGSGWISGSTELWLSALVLLAALAFDSRRSWLAGILLALALFAKESAIVAAPLLLADRFLLQGRRERSGEPPEVGTPSWGAVGPSGRLPRASQPSRLARSWSMSRWQEAA